MAGSPAMQLYFGDLKKDEQLSFCSWGARGVWIYVMGLMHDSAEYGVLRKPLSKIAQAVGAPPKLLRELVEHGVMRGCDKGLCEAIVWAPKHARSTGSRVILMAEQEGPIWYSYRMVKDAYVRTRRGESSRFGDSPKGGFGDDFGDSPNRPPNGAPTHASGDGPSFSSSSSTSEIGNSSTRAEIPEHADASARAVVEACKVLRKLGMFDVQPQRPELFDLVGRGCTVEQMALTASELALKAANFLNDTEMHPELLELFASGATQQQMLLTFEQYTHLRNCAPKLPYLAATLIGRAKDAARLGESHGSATTSTAFQAAHANVQRGGERGRSESAASRAERARREGDARDEAAFHGSAGFESA